MEDGKKNIWNGLTLRIDMVKEKLEEYLRVNVGISLLLCYVKMHLTINERDYFSKFPQTNNLFIIFYFWNLDDPFCLILIDITYG